MFQVFSLSFRKARTVFAASQTLPAYRGPRIAPAGQVGERLFG
jgi:hypothetical protein